jgi:hypothetical protein
VCSSDLAEWGRQGQYTVNDTLYFSHTDGAEILWTPDANQQVQGVQCLGYQQYLCLDEVGMRTEGVFYGIGLQKSGNTLVGQNVLKTTITPAPLPNGWIDADIIDPSRRTYTPYTVRGNSGFRTARSMSMIGVPGLTI